MELQMVGASPLQVSEATFGRDYNEALVHQVVVAYMNAGRQGSKGQKTRSEVSGGGKKPFRQKGTGRARAGSTRSPIWRAGGTVFAAKPQDWTQKVNRKMYRVAMRSILSELVRQDRLVVVDDFKVEDHKTKTLVNKLKDLGLKQVLIVTDAFEDGLDWNTTVKMVRTNFIGDADNPEWEYLTMDLTDDDCVTVHTLSANISAVEDGFSQTLTLSTTLPPQVDQYNAALSLVFPFVTVNVSSGIEQASSTDTTWKKLPFQQSSTVSLFSKTLSLTESFNYNLEDEYADSLKFALSWKGLQVAYTMQYTYGYDFDTDDGWTAHTDTEFLPPTASIADSTPAKTFRYWRNRISWAPTLSTSLVYDCQRPTNSYFKFIPAVTLKINDFLDLTFSSESRNSVLFRYIQQYTSFDGELPGETNPFIDLLDGFAFWDDDLRKSSGFKLKNLKITMTHSLCDWDLSSSFTVQPRLVTSNGVRSYDFSPYFTLSVIWKPLSSMKTQIVDNYGTWELNP